MVVSSQRVVRRAQSAEHGQQMEANITYIIAAAFILGTILLVWAGYFFMRVLLTGSVEQETNDLAGSVIFRVAALHGLILALVFAQELLSFQELRKAIVREATAVADVYYDLERYSADNAEVMQKALEQYIRIVKNTEWRMLADERRLSSNAWEQREFVYSEILDLEPQSKRQVVLQDHMLGKMQKIAEFRQTRENAALNPLSKMFWIPAIAGLVLVSMTYFVFRPTRLNLTLLSVYGGFSGLVLFVIYAFSDPFSEPNRLEPLAFDRLFEDIISQN